METNIIYNKSSVKMDEIDDNSIALVVTSPPYNVGKEYGLYEDKKRLDEYKSFIFEVLTEVKRILIPGGKVCINIADTGRNPFIPLNYHYTELMLALNLIPVGSIIWDKDASVKTSTAWGSWRSARNPHIRDEHEYILIFAKDQMGRDDKGESTIDSQEFMKFSKSVWHIRTANAKSIGHPAPFPHELPYRLIQFYTYKGDIVLDPFMGSGTTALVASDLNRKYIGYEIDSAYWELACNRLDSAQMRII